jgi:hypothetical protein
MRTYSIRLDIQNVSFCLLYNTPLEKRWQNEQKDFALSHRHVWAEKSFSLLIYSVEFIDLTQVLH